MFSILKKVAQLDTTERRLLARICLMLVRVRLMLLLQGLSYFTSHLEHQRSEPGAEAVSKEQLDIARAQGRLVGRAARHTPWQSTCLVQVLVLQRLLSEKGIPGTIIIGVRKESEELVALDAHAWLRCGNCIVNGERSGVSYVTLSAFSWGSEESGLA